MCRLQELLSIDFSIRFPSNMLSNPAVTVVIPTWNRPKMCQEAVASVMAQTWKDFQVLIVDDGSSSDAIDELQNKNWRDRRVKLIRQEHRGVSSARNRGISEAQGTFIAFLDDDDLWRPEKLERQMEFFRAHPEAVIVQTDEIWMTQKQDGRLCRVFPKRYHQKPNGHILPASLYRCLVSPSAVCLRKSVFDQIGVFDENLPACEDYDLWLRLGRVHPVYRMAGAGDLTVKRGGRPDQLSGQWGLDRYRILALKKFLMLPLEDSLMVETLKVLDMKCRIYAKGCRRHGRFAEAEEIEKLARTFTEPATTPS